MTERTAAVTTDELLAAARTGDEQAFTELVQSHQADLLALCYRMLGSLHDAEDAVQDTFVRAWRGLDRFEARSSLRSWLHTVATNVCLRELERRTRRVLPLDLGPAADPSVELGKPLLETAWIGPYPNIRLGHDWAPADARYEQKESVELAFVAALQHLPPVQRAVLIMRDVLAFSAGEVAASLETTTAAVNSALQRAHDTVHARLPAQSQQATLRAIGDARVREMVTGFIDAWEKSDVDAVVSLLAEDVVMAMPPLPHWFEGRKAVETFLRTRPLSGLASWRALPVGLNAQPATAHYLWDPVAGAFLGHSVTVLSFRDSKIAEIGSFLDGGLPRLCGLPSTLAAVPGG